MKYLSALMQILVYRKTVSLSYCKCLVNLNIDVVGEKIYILGLGISVYKYLIFF